ncbi:hypothetical protein D1BOALGB6SA_8458 [Olavius sp. associated proteobacterium Delta 1]|nr:hypothetical protein D1BOALGB6SA_8458 [Olavius sp. associated proteobacterium Delta 1]
MDRLNLFARKNNHRTNKYKRSDFSLIDMLPSVLYNSDGSG